MNIDAELRNADWLRGQRWTYTAGLAEARQLADDIGHWPVAEVRALAALPTYQHAPALVVAAVDARLGRR